MHTSTLRKRQNSDARTATQAKNTNHQANCSGCAHFGGDRACLSGMRWTDPVPADAFCHRPILYRHPDGQALIYHDVGTAKLIIENEQTGDAIDVPIGQIGLLELGHALIGIALKRG